MSLDSMTLYFVAAMIAALLGAMLLFFGRQEKNPALKWWGAAYLVGAASVALAIGLGQGLSRRIGELERQEAAAFVQARVSFPDPALIAPGANR